MGRFNGSRETLALAGKEAGAWRLRRFRAAGKEPLHPYADAKKRSALIYEAQHRRPQAGVQRFTTAEVTDAGNNHLVGNGYDALIGGDFAGRAEMFEGFPDRTDIACSVIDDRDHRSPLVLGSMRASCLSREHA